MRRGLPDQCKVTAQGRKQKPKYRLRFFKLRKD
nr:MAG TPA: hypothetical protein [Caudoviricetes sp.]